MAKSKGARIQITLEHKCEQGVYRYHTSKKKRERYVGDFKCTN